MSALTQPLDLGYLWRRREKVIEAWCDGELTPVYDFVRDDVPALVTRVRAAEAARHLAVDLLDVAETRIAALEAAARAVLTDSDLTAIIANTTAYENWVRHRAALAALLDPG